jgi:CheY-like chemotaxis protein
MRTILIVEDDEDIRAQLAIALRDEGYIVREAADGAQALATLSELSALPGLVLLDLMMPKMNGRAFLEVVSKMPALKSIPVVVITASPDARITGAIRVLRKPFGIDTLLAVVGETCPRT